MVKVNIKKNQTVSLDMLNTFNTDTWTTYTNQVLGKAICYRDWQIPK